MRMRKNLIVATAILAFTNILFAGEKYEIDRAHTHIGFAVKHMLISTVRGNFKEFSGTIVYDQNDLSKSSVEVTIQTASIDTDNERRDNHLRSDDFFNAEKFPQITFVSKKVMKTDDGMVVVGDLTIRDVTKEVEIPFEITGTLKTERGTRIGLHAELTIDRMEYGVKYDRTLDTGGLVVGNEVRIELDVEAIARKAADESN